MAAIFTPWGARLNSTEVFLQQRVHLTSWGTSELVTFYHSPNKLPRSRAFLH